jgi:putative membrane protein
MTMMTFPIRNTLVGLMCAGLLGSLASCKRSERSYQAPPVSPNPGTMPTTPQPGAPGAEDPVGVPPTPARVEIEKRDDLSASEMEEARRVLADLRQVNALEIALGTLAQERGTSAGVKEFGKQLVEDHRSSDSKVVELASKYRVAMTNTRSAGERSPAGAETAMMDQAATPVALNTESKKTLGKLRALRGAAFEREFVSTMLAGHQKAVDLVKGGREKIDNDEWNAVLGDIQSSVERHLEHARRLQAAEAARAAVPSAQPDRQGRRSPPAPSPTL